MMDIGLGLAGGASPPQAFGSAYGLLADVATTLCPADILSMVRYLIFCRFVQYLSGACGPYSVGV